MPQKRDRIILDTNLWISFILSKDYSQLDKIFKKDSISLLFSDELLEEFLEVATRPKLRKYFPNESLDQLLHFIEKKAEFIIVQSKVTVCRDPKDNFLLELALDGKATHLITGDKDLLVLEDFGKTKILTINNYLSK